MQLIFAHNKDYSWEWASEKNKLLWVSKTSGVLFKKQTFNNGHRRIVNGHIKLKKNIEFRIKYILHYIATRITTQNVFFNLRKIDNRNEWKNYVIVGEVKLNLELDAFVI